MEYKALELKKTNEGWLYNNEKWINKLKNPTPTRDYKIESSLEQKIKDQMTEFLNKQNWTFRNWQKKIFEAFLTNLLQKKPFKKGIIAGIGSGKTLIALAMSQFFLSPVVAAPLYIHSDWEKQARLFNFRTPKLTTYESIHKIKYCDFLILDEVLQVKNHEAKRTLNTCELSKNLDYILGMTGTPMTVNGLADLQWLNAIDYTSVPFKNIGYKYYWGINPHWETNKFGSEYVVEGWKTEEFLRFTQDTLINVDVSEITKDLPEKQYQTIELETPLHFKRAIASMFAENRQKAVAQARQITDGFIYKTEGEAIKLNDIKLKAIYDIVENNVNQQIIIYTAWTYAAKLIYEKIKNICKAEILKENYDEKLDKFKNNEIQVLILNTRISMGMNLQNCNIMIFTSNSLSPVDREQAEGRIYRQGQKNKCLFIDLVCKNTLDSKVLNKLNEYKKESSEFIGKLLEKDLQTLLGGN